jgi:hypothetical protein
MGNGDPVSQQQFFDTMNGTKKEILEAVEKVNDNVGNNNVSIGKIETKLERVDKLEDQVGSLKTWDRIDTIASGAVAAMLAALGIGRE